MDQFPQEPRAGNQELDWGQPQTRWFYFLISLWQPPRAKPGSWPHCWAARARGKERAEGEAQLPVPSFKGIRTGSKSSAWLVVRHRLCTFCVLESQLVGQKFQNFGDVLKCVEPTEQPV